MAFTMFLSSVFLLSLSLQLVGAEIFLGRTLPTLDLHAANLLEELERTLDNVHRSELEDRAGSIEDFLRPKFRAIPHDDAGLMSATAVRFLLHRYFVDRHGWYVAGFDTRGEAWSSPLDTQALQGSSEVFNERMGSRGLSLHETSLLAATLESYVHMEAVERLHAAFRLNGVSADEPHITNEQSKHALETWMSLFILGLRSDVDPEAYEDKHRLIQTIYPSWDQTLKWTAEVRKEVIEQSHIQDRNSFDAILKVVETISDRYGRWQDAECIELKHQLLDLETPGTGRVLLSEFYQAALNGQWQFSESEGYLKSLGSLDDSDAERPKLIVSNYINSPTNCVAASSYYYVCCINECESLLGSVEEKFAAPWASAPEIAAYVSGLPSSSEDAPRNLSSQLMTRLESIAETHNGKVPFHGRLFAQWLHHAYPRECPYPHMSGTTNPVFPEHWNENMGFALDADLQQMRDIVAQAPADVTVDELPWSHEEELFITCDASSPPVRTGAKAEDRTRSPARAAFRAVALVAIMCAMLVTLVRMLVTGKAAVSPTELKLIV